MMTEQRIDYETGEIVAAPTPTQDPTALASLFAKLSRAMGRLERLPKNGHNAHFNYDYVTDADVADAVRSALAVEGIAFLANMRDVQSDGKRTVVQFEFTFADGESGATWTCHWQGEAMDSQDKGTAKAATSGLKYFLLKNFLLSTGDLLDDADADDAPVPRKNVQTPRHEPAKADDNGKGKLADTPMTQFWARANALEKDGTLSKGEGKRILEQAGGSAEKALAKLAELD